MLPPFAHRPQRSHSRRNLTRCRERAKTKEAPAWRPPLVASRLWSNCKYRRPELASSSGAAYDSLDCRTDQGHSCPPSSTWFPLQPQAAWSCFVARLARCIALSILPPLARQDCKEPQPSASVARGHTLDRQPPSTLISARSAYLYTHRPSTLRS